MGPDVVVVTGASGFVGTAAVRALLERGARVRALVRRVPEEVVEGVEWVAGDLTEPGAVRGLCEGAGAVVHLASYIGDDEALCRAVNVGGTRAVMAEARGAEVRRVVQLSTAAVYGAGPHRGIEVGQVEPVPVSAVSRSRLAGERFALEAGGVVLRPGLVLGEGDRWVVPGLRELTRRVPARWDGGRALLSVVDVADLGRLIAALALPEPGRVIPSGVYHASHPVPVRIGELIAGLVARGELAPVPEVDWPWEVCLERFRASGGRASERQFALVGRDHWYVSEEVWRVAGCDPGERPG
ncbi:NAD-dependent epimerase/dehydratase family protein [Streptomyces roseirectus]|uniref:NAD-dependent epimerase/dehydratase family protein n=1 Tax=Streptomyces roseirectus TaxID=2768066 RepID=A0A7H0IMC5_9ACTN|nr:NAD-dependent epimerase/dehydratase family protein [Streptomyces roseirectus]QNP73941.1 NAD-dependent epimerase/dehydratase family protein [Streptomyces roseirectus]